VKSATALIPDSLPRNGSHQLLDVRIEPAATSMRSHARDPPDLAVVEMGSENV
jgi:hypothetical protein